MKQGVGYVALHRMERQAHLFGDLFVDQPFALSQQVLARGLELQAFGSLQQSYKDVLCKVRRIGGIAPSRVEPTVMATVKRLYCKLG